MDVAGLEPATPCLQSRFKNTMLMARLALYCVLYHRFPWFSAGFGPKLDSSFGMNPYSETISLGTLAVFIRSSVVSRPAPLMRVCGQMPSGQSGSDDCCLSYSVFKNILQGLYGLDDIAEFVSPKAGGRF